jgi:hypothetical protein
VFKAGNRKLKKKNQGKQLFFLIIFFFLLPSFVYFKHGIIFSFGGCVGGSICVRVCIYGVCVCNITHTHIYMHMHSLSLTHLWPCQENILTNGVERVNFD